MKCKKCGKIWLLASAVAVFAAGGNLFAAPAGSPVDLHGQLSVKNGQIVDKNNEPFQMRGMSFFWSTSGWGGEGYYNAGAVGWLASDWKASVVRAAMDPNSKGAWETVVTAAVSEGIYVIIDFHTHDYTDKDAAVTFFSTVSNSYKNTPNVIYEIFNEPCSGGGQSGKCKGDDWATQIKPYAQAVVSAIRANDTKNIIVIGTGNFSKRVDLAANSPVSGDNLVYTVHYYTAEPGTEHQSTLREWCVTALSKGAALLVTEFGISEADGGQVHPSVIDTAEANRWFDFLDDYQIGWANWSIHHKNEAASALKGSPSPTGNWGANDLSPSGTFIRNKLRLYANSAYSLTVDKTGGGTVTKWPDKATYTLGVPVKVTASASTGWKFVGYEGGGSDSVNVVRMNANKTLKAVFEESNIINKNGTFTFGTTSWTSSSNSALSLSHDNYQLKATVVTPGTSESGIYIQQTGIKLTQGHSYRLTFNARGQSARSITPRITSSTGVTNYLTPTPENIGTTESLVTRDFEFTAASVTNAVLRIDCGGNGTAFYIDNVKLVDTEGGTAALPRAAVAKKAAWSVVGSGGKLRLSGPAEAGAKVSLYDARGKAVRSFVAKDGLALGAGMPAGSYIAVVRNGAGREVYRARVSLVR